LARLARWQNTAVDKNTGLAVADSKLKPQPY